MSNPQKRKFLLGMSIVLLLMGGLLVIQKSVLARSQAVVPDAEQESLPHPEFAFLDQDGNNVLESGNALSTMETCGQCHDTEFIASHSFHSDLGLSEVVPAGQTASERPWDTSPGLYGKWEPLYYRYLSPQGDERTDLDDAGWIRFYADRLVGGGPAEYSQVEMNCFLCHLEEPNQDAWVQAIRSDQGEWAAAATLLGTGIVTQNNGDFQWDPSAFSSQGEITQGDNITEGDVANTSFHIQDPDNNNCAQCHGLVHTDLKTPLILTGCSLDNWQTATTGQVISPQKVSLSGVNLSDKSERIYSWDIHAERGLKCTDCHFSLNNPATYQPDAESSLEHLQFDPRRLEIGEYLLRPDHQFARGQSAQYTIAPELKGTMRRCESCHDAQTHASWLPYVERHMAEVSCETCHIPTLNAPAIQSYDWTVLQPDGQPGVICRGVEPKGVTQGGEMSINDLVTGFKPVLLQRSNIDGGESLAPYNLVTTWFWVSGEGDGKRPVLLEDLKSAWFSGDQYHPEVLDTFDADQDGQLSTLELRIDTPEKQALIASRLEALGLINPRIEGEIQPYSINHNVQGRNGATRDCQECHSDESRLAMPMVIADSVPGGILPAFVNDTNTQVTNGLVLNPNPDDPTVSQLSYNPVVADHDLYVFGHTRVSWVDWLGAMFFVAVLIGVAVHGSLRLVSAIRHPKPRPETKKVYMYHVYERFWHWLQTFVIVLLLFTGLIIHRPDIFGFLSFRYMVTFHNVLAAILVINAGLSLFYHLSSGEIRQFIPRPYGFFDQAIEQTKFYIQGIFRGKDHPFEKTTNKKLNPLQQITYFGILNVLLPLQIVTGALMWGVQRWSGVANMLGGLPYLAPFHSLVAWLFASFIVAHVYLTTTGPEPTAGIKAMMNGWEDVEIHHPKSSDASAPVKNDDSTAPAAAD